MFEEKKREGRARDAHEHERDEGLTSREVGLLSVGPELLRAEKGGSEHQRSCEEQVEVRREKRDER